MVHVLKRVGESNDVVDAVAYLSGHVDDGILVIVNLGGKKNRIQ